MGAYVIDIVFTGIVFPLFGRVDDHCPGSIDHINVTGLAHFDVVKFLFKMRILPRIGLEIGNIIDLLFQDIGGGFDI